MSTPLESDGTLIALAAQAIGMHWCRYDLAKLRAHGHCIGADMMWNPLENDKDAFRLAVELGMAILPEDHDVDIGLPNGQSVTETWHENGGDKYVATRRAITRAAAGVGADKLNAST